MTAIAYITDNKMLELNRINKEKSINFWRLSENNHFSKFNVGDVIFFLSKDKDMSRNKEKGIVGFGIAKDFNTTSINTMWNKYGKQNGYNSKKDFKDAINKVNKTDVFPKKISSIFLENVIFFQEPVYLSDAGKKISSRTESYIYLDDDGQLAFNLLEEAKAFQDIWSGTDDYLKIIERTQIIIILNAIYDKIKLVNIGNKKRSHFVTKKFLADNEDFKSIQGSEYEMFSLQNNVLEIVISDLFLEDKSLKDKIVIGQAYLYREYFFKLYPYDLDIRFYSLDRYGQRHQIIF